MAQFTWNGDYETASEWLPFGESLVQKLKQLANGSPMKMNHQPTEGVMIMTQCNPDCVYIDAAGGLDIVIRDTHGGTFFARRAENPVTKEDEVVFVPTDVQFGHFYSWSNNLNLACSAAATTIYISGNAIPLPEVSGTGRLAFIYAACALGKRKYAAVISSYMGYATTTIKYTLCIVSYDSAVGDYVADVIYESPVGEFWDCAIFEHTSKTPLINILVAREASGLYRYTFTLEDDGGYRLSVNTLLSNTPPIETRISFELESWSLTGFSPSYGDPPPFSLYPTSSGHTSNTGAYTLEWNLSRITTVPGNLFDPPFLTDTLGSVALPVKSYAKNETLHRSTLDYGGYDTWDATGISVIWEIGGYGSTGIQSDYSHKEESISVFGASWSPLPSQSTTSYVLTDIVGAHSYDATSPTDRGAIAPGSHTQTRVGEGFTTSMVQFVDRFVRVYTTITSSTSDLNLTASKDTPSVTATRTKTESGFCRVEVNGITVFEYPLWTSSSIIDYSASYAVNNETSAGTIPESTSPPSMPPSTTATSVVSNNEFNATPLLGSKYAYTKKLYAVKVYDGVDSSVGYKILFFPVDNGVVSPKIIGTYDYGEWPVYMGLHSG